MLILYLSNLLNKIWIFLRCKFNQTLSRFKWILHLICFVKTLQLIFKITPHGLILMILNKKYKNLILIPKPHFLPFSFQN